MYIKDHNLNFRGPPPPATMMVACAMAFAAVLMLGALTSFSSVGSPAGTSATPTVDGAAGIDVAPESLAAVERSGWVQADAPLEALFVEDWERSLDGRYVLSGVLYRAPLSTAQSNFGIAAAVKPDSVERQALLPASMIVYVAQLDRRHQVNQLGGAAIVVDPTNGSRVCQKVHQTFWCSTDADAPTPDQRFMSTMAAIKQAVTGETATHRLYLNHGSNPIDPLAADGSPEPTIAAATQAVADLNLELRCWDVRALTGDRGHEWGRRSTFCFDQETGALVLTRTVGQYRVEVQAAVMLSSEVSTTDLDPR